MSWSYPPRSRSRSPRSRPPHLDSGPDTYRPDVDGYDRDRSWPNYDRHYEYGRRGRSPSPPLEDGGRKRRRSPSPYERDRYDPRPRYVDDYDAHSRGYCGYSPRRAAPLPYPTSRRPPPDPHSFDYPASLKQYAEWFRFFFPQQAVEEDNADKAAEQEAGDGSRPRNGIKARWEKYKKEFSATQLQTMFDHHRKSPWFAEKYDPAQEFQNLRFRVRKEGWKGRFDTFIHDLESGKYDPDLNEPEESPISPAKETSTTVDHLTTESNGDPAVPAEDTNKAGAAGEDEMQFNVEVDDEPVDPEPNRPDANGKASSDRRGSRGEEVSVAPEGNQVMIRTIPPDIGRVKLEEACGKIPGFVYLALGDPLQKRNYYRAGWLKFRDDANMVVVMSELADKKIEGFKLHVAHTQRPFTNKVRFTPEAANKPDRLQKDLENAKALVAILEDQAAKLRQFKPLTTAISICDGQTEDTVMESIENAEDEQDPLETGSDAVERRIQKVMSDISELKALDVNEEAAYEEKKTIVALDMYIAYMRAAYNACYYCAVVTDHVEELQRKCIKHVRKPMSKGAVEDNKPSEAEKDKEEIDYGEGIDKDKEKRKEKDKRDGWGKDKFDGKRGNNDERWLEWLDSKVALLINRDGVDPCVYLGKSYDEELTKAVEPYLKQEEEGRFRCKTCQKLFKATSFVEKHIANKHPDHVKSLDDIPYFNNFALDPHRIQPFTHPPPTSNSGQAPPQAYGLQGPPPYHGGDYSRMGAYYSGNVGYPQAGYPPPYHGSNWDPHGYSGAAPPGGYGIPGYLPPMNMASRRDESLTARRLSDRISGFSAGAEGSSLPPAAGLPPKPTSALDSALVSGSGNGSGGGRRKGGRGDKPPPPPPADAKEDPRAAVGKKVSYHDMDSVAEGDVELCY